MQNVFDDRLLMQYTYYGLRNKNNFSLLSINKLIFGKIIIYVIEQILNIFYSMNCLDNLYLLIIFMIFKPKIGNGSFHKIYLSNKSLIVLT